MSSQVEWPIIYILVAVIILLAALAAAGSWLRGGGIKRDEAESMFEDAQERHRQELDKLRQTLDETRAANAETLAKSQSDVSVRIRELEGVVASAARDQGDCLTTEMESVGKLITESQRRSDDRMENMTRTLENIQLQVSKASEQMSRTLEDLARQQREQKAQSTIQLCEALISSLGTLKSSISNQIAQDIAVPVDSEIVSEKAQITEAVNNYEPVQDDDIDTHHDEDALETHSAPASDAAFAYVDKHSDSESPMFVEEANLDSEPDAPGTTDPDRI